MASRTFPGAIKTFTVYRRNQVQKVGNNVVPVAPGSVTPIATGLSITLKDMQDLILTSNSGAVFTGIYLAMTFTDTPIIIGDILADEAELAPDGNPVRYEVQGKTIYPIFVKMHLRRTDIGV